MKFTKLNQPPYPMSRYWCHPCRQERGDYVLAVYYLDVGGVVCESCKRHLETPANSQKGKDG